MSSISGATLVTRKDGVVEAAVADTHVLLNEELSYSGLDTVGQRVWQLLESPQRVDELVTTLLGEYDVAEDECRRDVADFVDELLTNHLVDVS